MADFINGCNEDLTAPDTAVVGPQEFSGNSVADLITLIESLQLFIESLLPLIEVSQP